MRTFSSLVAASALSAVLASPASAASINEFEANGTATNNSLATAQAIAGGAFTTPVPGTVFNPPGYFTATVNGAGGDEDVDFFSFVVASASNAYFDIDNETFPFDSILTLFNSAGTAIAFNDDSYPEDPGTSNGLDAFLGVFTLPSAGTYYLAVSQFSNFANGVFSATSFLNLSRPDNEFGGSAVVDATVGDSSFGASGIQPGAAYTLHLSLQDPLLEATAVPEPTSMVLLGSGLVAAYRARRRRS